MNGYFRKCNAAVSFVKLRTATHHLKGESGADVVFIQFWHIGQVLRVENLTFQKSRLTCQLASRGWSEVLIANNF